MIQTINANRGWAYLLLFCTLFISPSLLSLSYSYFGLVITFIIFYAYVILNKNNIKIYPLPLNIVILNVIYWAYLLIQTMFIPNTMGEYLLQTTISNISMLIVFAFLLSNLELNYYYFKFFIKLMYYLSFSFGITLIITQFIDVNDLFYNQLNIGSYHSGGNVYFPFTIVYGIMHSGEFALPKFQVFFRESGIAQAFLIWGIFNLKKYNLYKLKYILVLHLGLIGTFSTTALAVYFITLAIYLVVSGKLKLRYLLMSIVTIIVAYYSIYNMPVIGIEDKAITHSESISERINSNFKGIRELASNPFGEGFKINDHENSGISIIALTSKIGFIGLVLVLFLFFGPIRYTKNKNKYLVSIFPIFITALVAQPIAGDALIGIILMENANYYSNKTGRYE